MTVLSKNGLTKTPRRSTMSHRQQIDRLQTAARFAQAKGDLEIATELTDHAAWLEEEADRRPGDFADDAMGDPSFARVPGMACS
jgi:hypothetical protein